MNISDRNGLGQDAVGESSANSVVLEVEGESGSGDGDIMMRSLASNDKTVLLMAGESRSYSLNNSTAGFYLVSVRYSNDNYGPLETVAVTVNDGSAGSFQAADTGDSGLGWNIFLSEDLRVVQLVAGTNTIDVSVSGGDGYGVEIDLITFTETDPVSGHLPGLIKLLLNP